MNSWARVETNREIATGSYAPPGVRRLGHVMLLQTVNTMLKKNNKTFYQLIVYCICSRHPQRTDVIML